ncbi:ATPase domain-containing protein [[Eubacterium] cellulosolvens]
MAYINRTKIYIELIQEILNANKDVLSLDFLNNGLGGLTEESPILSKLSIDEDMQLQSSMPDFDGALEALRTFVDFLHFYIQKLLSEKDVEQRFTKIAEDFIHEHSIEILESDLMTYLSPNFFEEKGKKEKLDINQLRQEEPKKQTLIIYETLFTVYLQEAFKTDDRGLFFSEVLKLKKTFPILNQFLITQSGDVTIIPKEDDTAEKMVVELGEVFDYFVDFASPSLGSDMAFKRAREIIKSILGLLEDIPDKLGITSYILKGAMAKRIPTGIDGFDSMIQGGIPRGKSILIQASAGSEKNFFISHFIKHNLEHNSSFIVTLAKIPPKIFRVQMKTLGLNTISYEKKSQLKIIDWYSWRKPGNSNETKKESEMVIKAGSDLSKLWMAIEKSISGFSFSPTKCAVFNILTPALSIFEFDQVYNFIQEIVEKFKDKDITALFLIEKEAHKALEVAKFRVLFDGVIDIESKEVEGKVTRKIRVLSMRGTDFDPDYRPMTLQGTKLMVTHT